MTTREQQEYQGNLKEQDEILERGFSDHDTKTQIFIETYEKARVELLYSIDCLDMESVIMLSKMVVAYSKEFFK